MPFTIFKKVEDIDTNSLRFRKYQDLWDVRYKPDSQHKSSAVYLQTPSLALSMFEEGKESYYLTCQVDTRFAHMIQALEMAVLDDQLADMKYWGFDPENTMVNEVESKWVPSIKMSSVNRDYNFHIKVPKGDDVDVYDQDKTRMDMSLLREGYTVRMLLLLDGVVRENGYYRLKFVLQQVKAQVPKEVWQTKRVAEDIIESEEEEEKVLGHCQIEVSEDDQESNYPLENSKKYREYPHEEFSEDVEEEEEEEEEEEDED
jgi:hypothetical protein